MHSQEGEERDLESTPIPFEIVSGRLLQSNPSFSSTPGTAIEDEKSIDFDVINDRVLNARPSKPSSTPGSILLALSDSFDEHSNMGAGPRGGLMKGGGRPPMLPSPSKQVSTSTTRPTRHGRIPCPMIRENAMSGRGLNASLLNTPMYPQACLHSRPRYVDLRP